MSDADASVGVVVPAAGAGNRMGGARKPFLSLLGRPVLEWALEPFLAHPRIGAVVVALAPSDAASPPAWLTGLDSRIHVVAGGSTRTDSVANALAELPSSVTVVVVHDGARPLVTREWIDACIQGAAAGDGAVVGHPAIDTIKRVDESGFVVRTVERAQLWQVQTPQAFPRALLEEAYALARREGSGGTDDAQLVEAAGGRVRLIRSAGDNRKITFPVDLLLAEAVLRARARPAGDPGTPANPGASE